MSEPEIVVRSAVVGWIEPVFVEESAPVHDEVRIAVAIIIRDAIDFAVPVIFTYLSFKNSASIIHQYCEQIANSISICRKYIDFYAIGVFSATILLISAPHRSIDMQKYSHRRKKTTAARDPYIYDDFGKHLR